MKLNNKITDELNLKGLMAITSFSVGTIIACVCLFAIEPLGEITTTAISIVSEFLVLTGALLGVDAHFDHKLKVFETRLNSNNK